MCWRLGERSKNENQGTIHGNNGILRLSSEDKEKAVESNSIKNQRQLILEFLKKHPEIRLIGEKVDDGYSGVNFDRPGFQEMMEETVPDGATVLLSRIYQDLPETLLSRENICSSYFLSSASGLLLSMIIMTVPIPTFRQIICISL